MKGDVDLIMKGIVEVNCLSELSMKLG